MILLASPKTGTPGKEGFVTLLSFWNLDSASSFCGLPLGQSSEVGKFNDTRTVLRRRASRPTFDLTYWAHRSPINGKLCIEPRALIRIAKYTYHVHRNPSVLNAKVCWLHNKSQFLKMGFRFRLPTYVPQSAINILERFADICMILMVWPLT